MSGDLNIVLFPPETSVTHATPDWPTLAAFADGLVADTAEPLTAEAGRPVAEPDRDDTDAVSHA